MKKNKNLLVFSGLIFLIFLSSMFYYRTGYFESSNQNNLTTFYTSNDSITSKKYYRDLSGNWVLLDKKIVLTESDIKSMTIQAE
jgi:hypothetical protein